MGYGFQGQGQKISPQVVKRALGNFTHARERWQAGGDVVMLGRASAWKFKAKDGKECLNSSVDQLALLSVSPSLTPLPTPILERLFVAKQAEGEWFVVGPEDDKLLKQWSGP